MGTFQVRRALVTGGAGFIGSNLIRYWLAEDPTIQIVNLDALTYAGSMRNLEGLAGGDRHIFVQGDVCASDLVTCLLRKHEINAIVHLAAESHVDNSILGPAAFIRTNVVGTFTMLDAARKYWLEEKGWGEDRCRFHQVSTDEVFGSLTDSAEPFRETSRYLPNSPYSATKAASDHLVRAYHHTYRLPVTLSNCSNNYGPFQHSEKFVPTIIRSCMAQNRIPVYGDGKNVRDWLHVEDHAAGLLAVLRNGRTGETYNIGGGSGRRNIDVVRHICSIFDDLFPRSQPYDRLIEFVADRPGHDRRYAIDHSKIRAELGWAPKHIVEEGLKGTVEWYLRMKPEWMVEP